MGGCLAYLVIDYKKGKGKRLSFWLRFFWILADHPFLISFKKICLYFHLALKSILLLTYFIKVLSLPRRHSYCVSPVLCPGPPAHSALRILAHSSSWAGRLCQVFWEGRQLSQSHSQGTTVTLSCCYFSPTHRNQAT